MAINSEGGRTHDGVEACAGRVRGEIDALLAALPTAAAPRAPLPTDDSAVRLSLIGHSLGGLVCRAVAARYFEATAATASAAAVHPAAPPAAWPPRRALELDTLVTIATPHLGARRPPPIAAAPRVAGAADASAAHALLAALFGRTGRELLLLDRGN